MICNNKIELVGNGIVVTYCVLQAAHTGMCKPDELVAIRYQNTKKEKGK